MSFEVFVGNSLIPKDQSANIFKFENKKFTIQKGKYSNYFLNCVQIISCPVIIKSFNISEKHTKVYIWCTNKKKKYVAIIRNEDIVDNEDIKFEVWANSDFDCQHGEQERNQKELKGEERKKIQQELKTKTPKVVGY
jgi:hypothetical protein